MANTNTDPKTSKEELYIQQYCDRLGKGYCEQAKEHAEKSNHGDIPGPIVNSLANLANNERAYLSLMFLEQKWIFSRKDPLKNAFLSLQSELKTISEHEKRHNSSVFIVNISMELSFYCGARSDCIDFFERMLKPSSSGSINDLEEMATDLLEKHEEYMNNPALKTLKESFQSEITMIQMLLQTNCKISEWSFFSSLMNLHKVRHMLEENIHLLKKETVKSGFFSFREKAVVASSAVHQWLHIFHQFLMSKYTLYFFKALSEQAESSDEMKTLCMKNSVDYISRCQSLCKKHDHMHIMFAFDCRHLKEMPRHGYTLPQTRTTQKKENYIKILEVPGKILANIWPSLESAFDEAKINDKVVTSFNKQIACTLYTISIEEKIHMAIIIEGKRLEKDSHINAFMNEISASLKPRKIFSMLRPGNK